MLRFVVLAVAICSARAGYVAPSYPLAYAAAAPVVHYEKAIPYNVPPYASTVEYSARSLYGVPAYAATPVAHSPGPVAQVSTLLRSPHVAEPVAPSYPLAHAASFHVAHAAPLPVAHAHLGVPHHAPLAVKAHHPLAYAAAPHAYAAGVAHPYLAAPLQHGLAPALYGR